MRFESTGARFDRAHAETRWGLAIRAALPASLAEALSSQTKEIQFSKNTNLKPKSSADALFCILQVTCGIFPETRPAVAIREEDKEASEHKLRLQRLHCSKGWVASREIAVRRVQLCPPLTLWPVKPFETSQAIPPADATAPELEIKLLVDIIVTLPHHHLSRTHHRQYVSFTQLLQ